MTSPRPRDATTTTAAAAAAGGAPLRGVMMTMLLVATIFLVDGNNAETTTAPPPEELLYEENTQSGSSSSIKSFSAREFAEFATTKRLIKPEKSLDDWREFGFAEGGARAGEFEALRVDEAEGTNGVRRLHASKVTADKFRNKYELLHEPLVIEGIPEAEKWEAAEWTIPLLAERYPAMHVRVAGAQDKHDVKMTMADFGRYTRTQKDDTPLYVFDPMIYDDKYGKKLMTQYSVPKIFSEDLFQLVKGEPGYPAYRWLLLGPKRSGSVCHNDPLGTSAWNTLISGRKLWFFAPPYLEDIVLDTKDKTIAKWFLDDLPKLRAKYEDQIIVYVQQPGETMFVPAFWLHAVLNLDDSVAVTQNFVSTHTFPESWDLTSRYLKRFSQKWLQQLVIHHEDLALKALRMNAARRTQEARREAARREEGNFDDADDDDGDDDEL